MAAYIVFTRERTTNSSELETYTKNVGPSLAGHTIKILAAYGHHEVIEGADVEGVVIVEFPTFAEAKAWYDSPTYREVREHRFRGAEYRAVIVEGVSAGSPLGWGVPISNLAYRSAIIVNRSITVSFDRLLIHTIVFLRSLFPLSTL